MDEYIERNYIRKMAMLEMAYTMETETDAAVVLRMIDDAPAADAAPVVRCKDCKHAESYLRPDGKTGVYCRCPVSIFDYANGYVFTPSRNVDDFCSYGERRDEPCTTQ